MGGTPELTYEGTENWERLSIDGHCVFVYKDKVTNAANQSQTLAVDILAIVPQGIKDTLPASVTMTAYLGQADEDRSAQEVFITLFLTP